MSTVSNMLGPRHINKVVKITLEKDGDVIFAAGVLKQYQVTETSVAIMFEGETEKQSFSLPSGFDELDGFTVEVFE